MTPTADMTRHPDVSEISDLTEGLLSPAQSAEVGQHLDGCEPCADVRASLEEIRGLLGALPGVPEMPEDVVSRIDAALATEAPLDSAAPDPSAHVSRETSPTAQQSETKPGDRPAGHARGTTGPGRGHRGRRRRTTVLGAIFGVAAVGLSVLVVQSQSGGDNRTSAQDVATTSSAGDEGHYSASTLRSRVKALVSTTPPQGETKSNRGRTPQERTPSIASAEPRVARSPSVPACVQLGTERTDAPIAVEQGVYQGIDAYLLVLPDLTDLQRVHAFVIDAACVSETPSSPGKVLLTDSFPLG
ncbi:anti-sigma factor family protein [Streptomyces sp. NPDC051018]|uniref:anti-sigma factor family protein n=1 Tax=Streptomyces sp. NPDC051018 TaxID=3365639 RepID=UPI003789A003